MNIRGFRARKHLRSLASVVNGEWRWWQRPDDIRGPWGPKASWHLSYRWGKHPKKPHPGNLFRPGIEPWPAAWQARMLPPVSQRHPCYSLTFNIGTSSHLIHQFRPYVGHELKRLLQKFCESERFTTSCNKLKCAGLLILIYNIEYRISLCEDYAITK